MAPPAAAQLPVTTSRVAGTPVAVAGGMLSLVRLVGMAMLAAASLWSPIRAHAAEPTVVVMHGNVTAQIVVTDDLEASPPGYRVRWIAWDSGFRGSDLRPGDRIIAVDGKRLVFPDDRRERQRVVDRSIGHMFESQGWAAAGKKDGAAISLTVVRRKARQGWQTLEAKGTLRAERRHKGTDSRAIFGPGGPSGWMREGGPDAWDGWYDKLVQQGQRVLDGGWQRHGFANRYELDQLRALKPRLDLLKQKYPGPFADSVAHDYARIEASLLGNRYELTAADLAYRSAVEQRVAAVTAAGIKAREAFLAARAASRIEPFPAIDPLTGNRRSVKGKVVVLPTLGGKDFLMEAGRCFMLAGDRKQGRYFIDCEAPATRRMFESALSYQRLVDPKIGRSYALIARITGEPMMLTLDAKETLGLEVELLGATIGDRMFVDLTVQDGKRSRFAGEAALLTAGEPRLAAGATPVQVMEAFVRAVKAGQEETWTGLFATWRAERRAGYVAYLPSVPLPRTLPSTWVTARNLILDRVHDVRVVWVGDVEKLMTGKEHAGAPVVEQIAIEVDHVGKLDGEYRTFSTVAVNRRWLLQRVNGGPWRIATIQGI